jgi:acyl-CoA reductase-like NAD-dependent aldehyde dehydrogenase
MTERIDVKKTYKLFINGKFVRSESGYSYEVLDCKSNFVANVSTASRKDARDAVTAARAAAKGWSGLTAYNRGQILYRIGEVLESRRAQLVSELVQVDGLSEKRAHRVIDITVDRLVWYAGWADKLAAIVGSNNPVAGPFFNFSVPEPSGVVAIVAPQNDSLLGLISTIAPVIVTGNTAVVVTSYSLPITAITVAEILATSDVPAGVVNILTGDYAVVGPWLAEHQDVDAIDLTGAANVDKARELEALAAVNIKRVLRPSAPDWEADPGVERMRYWLETKTVWHPIGF